MIKKIGVILYFIIFAFSLSMYLFFGLIFKNSNKLAEHMKNLSFDSFSYIYQKGFNSPLLYNGNYEKTNKIDIFIANHTHTFDFIGLISIIRQFDDRNVYFVSKKEIVYYLGLGLIWSYSNDIKINRSIDKDKESLVKFVNSIDTGIIFIFPEGTRYSLEKLSKAQEYSKNNNLPIFKNMLYPKMKGLFLIIKQLKLKNKLGNIIDCTLLLENLQNKKAYLPELLVNNLGNTYIKINTINTNKLNLNSYEEFKPSFIEIWKKKEQYLENYKNYKYKNADNTYKTSSLILKLLVSVIFLKLIYNTNGKFLIYYIIIYYILIILKNKYINLN